MKRGDRLRMLVMVLAPLCAAQALVAPAELALHFGPLVLVLGLLSRGSFVGEERIAARCRRIGPALRAGRRRAQRWRPRVERAPAGLLVRSPCLVRGPPFRVRAFAV
jgi:hypothetical protein